MGTLRDVASFLEERRAELAAVEKRLSKLQAVYETFFSEVSRTRETELEQLTALLVKERDSLPDELARTIANQARAVEVELEQKLAALRACLAAAQEKAEALRSASVEAEAAVRRKNVRLDRDEEALKARSEELLGRIASYNERIRQLGRGFGFFSNLLGMRRLDADRAELVREQDDVAARIDALRGQWEEAAEGHAAKEEELRAKWVEARTAAAALQAKLDHLTTIAPALRQRTTLERVLFARQPPGFGPADESSRCARCQKPLPPEVHFCPHCAQRTGTDRPDLVGSLEEVAELNVHFERFRDGMRACQELIGLVRGLVSGHDALIKSVEAMHSSEQMHKLVELSIDVPTRSRKYAKAFAELGQKLAVTKGHTPHPVELAEQARELLSEVLTEQKIRSYFEAIGQELSKQATAQWG